MAKKSPEDKGLAARAERGEYDLIEPLDYLLMSEMPPEGTTGFELYPIGSTVRDINKKFPKLTSNQIMARVRSLHVQLLVKKVKMIAMTGNPDKRSTGGAWQVTEAGQELIKKWREKQSNGN